MIAKANTIKGIYGAVEERALEIDEINQFYCETDKVRGDSSARFLLKTMIETSAESGRSAHILFVGYRGCGKSTELNHLQKDLQKEYIIVSYSVMEELDPLNIEYIELFIVSMERLFRLAGEMGLQIDKNFLDHITNWTKSREISEIIEKHFTGEVGGGTKTKFGIPYLHEFFLNMKLAAKASKSFKETIKETLEPKLADLIRFCNELVTEVRIQIMKLGYKDIVIFIEDLDKILFDKARKIFFNYAAQLTQLKATIIYTFPVTLYFNTGFGAIRAYFPYIIELPMVKIKLRDGTDYRDGIDTLKKIVTTRINVSLFANDGVLEKFVKMTGGVIRDLFIMLHDASGAALYEQSATINENHYQIAYRKLKAAYNNTVADYKDEKGTVLFKARELYEAMANLVKSVDKQPDNDDMMLLLRQNLCVLSYNGDGWCDVHPAMYDVISEKGYLK